MRLERLEVAGFFHFAQPAILDLREVPEGLVALTGPNGGGKTRLLDAPLASVYGPGLLTQAFPSRDRTLATYATSREAYLDTIWTVDDVTTRLRVNVDGVKRVVDAVLSDASGPRNDGKVTTFKDAVAARFPSRQSVLCSAFAAQNRRGSFVELGQKERLELFAELVDLAHYQAKHETAKACAAVAESVRATLLGARDVLQLQTSETVRQELERRAATTQAALEAAVATHTAVGLDTGRLEVERATVDETARRHLAAQALVTQLMAQATEKRQRHARSIRESADLVNSYGRQQQDLAARFANNQLVLSQAQAIRAQEAAAGRDQASLATVRRDLAAAEAALADRHRLRLAAEAQVPALRQAERDLADAQEQANLVNTVPCLAQGPYAACRFLARAAEASARIFPLTQQLADSTVRAELDAALVNEETAQRVVTGARAAVQALERQLAGYALLPLVPALGLAEQRLADLTRQQVEAEAAFHAQQARLRAEQGDLNAALANVTQDIQAAQVEAETTQAASEMLNTLDARLVELRHALAHAQRDQARLELQRDQVATLQQEWQQKQASLAVVQQRLAMVETEWLAWQALATACGRDGLPRLEIDAAGPTISDTTNALLSAAFGTRFSLQLVTQVATADGKGLKESFTVEVYDNDHGGEARDIADLSGGERVVVEEALRAAIAVFVNQRHRRPVRTCFRDETTGALDPANGVRYVAMLRRMHEVGGFAHTLFVTHSPELAALADAQVRVADGQPTVALPPYE